MHPSVQQLLKVQGVDSEMRFLRDAKIARPKELDSERRKLDQALAEVERGRAAMKEARLEIDRGEMEVKTCDAAIDKNKISLNSAKTNEEFSVLRAAIDKTTAERGEIEEQVLEKLSALETLGERLQQLEGGVAREQKVFDRKRADVETIVSSLGEKLGRLEADRGGFLDGIDPEHLEMYERILNRYENGAISMVHDGVCNGCHMTVNSQEVAALRLHRLVRCRNCSRLLYLDAEDEF